MLAVGTTLQVYPVAHAVPIARANGARIVIINAQPTQFDHDRRRGAARADRRSAAAHLRNGGVNPMNSTIQAQGIVQIDDERVKVTEWRFAPGAATGWHKHAHDYVVVPLTSGKLRLDEPGGSRIVELTLGVSYNRPVGVEHDVVNVNDFEFRFVEIELK
jgi:beta-alanine degradation protein BauB